MVESLFKIRVNSTESNKDKGFEILQNSGLSVMCLEDENYVVPERGVLLLKERGVKYDILTVDGVKPHAPKTEN